MSKTVKEILHMDPFELAGVSKNQVMNLDFKLQEAADLRDFNKEDHKLVKMCAGYDLLTSSMARTYCMLAANKLEKEAA